MATDCAKFVGRIEKRLPIVLVVQLARVQDEPAPGMELTFTDNISTHGACVVSIGPSEVGRPIEVTSVKDRVTRRGKVKHCQKRTDSRYSIGLRFDENAVAWPTYRTYSGSS